MDVCWIVAHLSGGIEEEAKGTVGEDSSPIEALAEFRATIPLRKEPVLLALVGLAGLIIEGGGGGHQKEDGGQPKHCVLLQ